MKRIIRALLTSLMLVLLAGNVALAEDDYVLPLDEVTGYIVEEEVEDYPVSEEFDLLGAGVPSEAEAYASMIALKSQYPEGMTWTNDNKYGPFKGLSNTYMTGGGCAGFAFLLSDEAFGSLPARQVYNMPFEDVHVGDILRINNNGHSVVVLERHTAYLILAEGNYNSSIHWGRKYTKAEYEANLTYVYTRYPEGYFSDEPTCSIAFESNGGSGAPDEITINKNTLEKLPDTVPTKDFSTFLGWSEQPDATKADYLAGGSYSFAHNTVLYAVWQLNYIALSSTVPQDVAVSMDADGCLYRFIPSKTDTYVFWAKNFKSVSWYAYDENMRMIGRSSSSGSFGAKLTLNLTASKVYYVGMTSSSASSGTVNFTLNITDSTGGSSGENPGTEEPGTDLSILKACYYLYNCNLSLYESYKVGLNFYVIVPDDLDISKTTYNMTVDGKSLYTTTFNSSMVQSQGTVTYNGTAVKCKLYKASLFIPVKGLGTDVKFCLYYDGGLEDTYTVAVRDYAEYCLGQNDCADLEKVLLKKLLNFGSCTQTYFGWKSDDLANNILAEEDKALNRSRDLSQYKYVLSDNSDAVDYIGSSVILESDYTIRHYFRTSDKDVVQNGAVTVGGSKKLLNWVDDNIFYVDIYNIDIRKVKDTYALSFVSGSQVLSLDYSVMSYFERATAKKSGNTDLMNLTYSMLDYE